MSDMNDGDSGKKRKTSEGESGKFYLLPSSSTITPSNNPFCFELRFRFLSLSYSPTGNDEEKSGGERKRQNMETMETEEEVTEIKELELLGGKQYCCIYACLERANLSELDVPALIQEIDMLLHASYLYLNQSTPNHFSKSMPYQLLILNHLFILNLSLAVTMVTPYSLQIIPDDEELKKEEDQLVEDRSEGRRAKRKTMAELTPKGQAERKAAETKLETAKSEQLRRSEGASLPVPKKSGVFPKDSEAAGPSKPRKACKSKWKAQKVNGIKKPCSRERTGWCVPRSVRRKGKVQTEKEGQLSPVRQPPI